ncbi:hypothetical protein MC885_018039 [Smutsia gigantea]|nr:hypothetical protein MC885_018039 [Smutsia gigantea]
MKYLLDIQQTVDLHCPLILEWSAIEKEMGDGLQSAGHHMDVYASSIDDILEDEEHYADQLKEYLFYAEALRAVCRKHELMQYDLEMAAQDLASKKLQCEELATGLFGQETPEQREARIKVLEEQINEGEQQLKSKNLEGREFVKNAWADIERFKEQKNRDLKEALISYAVMQISMCKKTGQPGLAPVTAAEEKPQGFSITVKLEAVPTATATKFKGSLVVVRTSPPPRRPAQPHHPCCSLPSQHL